jgi:hypothetical protein
VGDWPRTDGGGDHVISPEEWADLADAGSRPVDPVVFAFDVTPDRSRSAIAVAAKRADGLFHVEIVDRQAGTGWVTARLAGLFEQHKPAAVVCDGVGPAASLMFELQSAGVPVGPVNTQEHAQACGLLFDNVQRQTLRHLGTPELAAAVKGAVRRPLGDAWAWSRKNSQVDISPLVAVTLALWAVDRHSAPWVGW